MLRGRLDNTSGVVGSSNGSDGCLSVAEESAEIWCSMLDEPGSTERISVGRLCRRGEEGGYRCQHYCGTRVSHFRHSLVQMLYSDSFRSQTSRGEVLIFIIATSAEVVFIHIILYNIPTTRKTIRYVRSRHPIYIYTGGGGI